MVKINFVAKETYIKKFETASRKVIYESNGTDLSSLSEDEIIKLVNSGNAVCVFEEVKG